MQAEANEAIREYAAAVDKAEDATDALAVFPNMFGSISYLTKAGTPLVSLSLLPAPLFNPVFLERNLPALATTACIEQ